MLRAEYGHEAIDFLERSSIVADALTNPDDVIKFAQNGKDDTATVAVELVREDSIELTLKGIETRDRSRAGPSPSAVAV